MGRGGHCDFGQLEQFIDDMDAVVKEIDIFYTNLARELAARILKRVKKRTPEDTGWLVKNWTAGGADIDSWGIVEKNGDAYTITIKNEVEYATYVEYGHRTRDHLNWIEGEHMLEISVSQVEKFAPKLLEKRLQQKLGEIFNVK